MCTCTVDITWCFLVSALEVICLSNHGQLKDSECWFRLFTFLAQIICATASC